MVWARTGFWRMQHGPVPMSNGRILLFDNQGRFNPEGEARSRIVEFDPTTSAIHWSYGADERQPLHSEIRGWVQALSNGNVLITESQRGRLVEVTREGEVAWDFRHPLDERAAEQRYRPIVTGGARIPASDIGFELNWRERVEAVAPEDASPRERAELSWSLLRNEDA